MTGRSVPCCQDRNPLMRQSRTSYPTPLRARLETLRYRISRDEYLPDAAQIADKFIGLERILPASTKLHIRSAG
jgi:hypothetical protein